MSSQVVNSNNLTGEQVLNFMGVSKKAVRSVQDTIAQRGDYSRYCRRCHAHGIFPQSFKVWAEGED